MSGGGFMSNMQTSLKNNRRKKKRLFDTLEKYVKAPSGSVKINKQASPEQLKRIRDNIRKENKTRTIKTVIYTMVISIFIYILFNFA